MSSLAPTDWEDVRLGAFDVGGTLYRQRSLRLRIARDMLLHTMVTFDVNVIRVVGACRRIRERLAVEDFDRVLVAETANATSTAPERVHAIVSEWMELRPIPYLKGCLHAGITKLFAGLQRAGKIIGILSDYPAEAKLAAMGLTPHHVVSAIDVGLLKPHCKGLQLLIEVAGVTAANTVFIGDRADRDGVAGRRAGVRTLIRSSKPIKAMQTFKTFHDPLFVPFLKS